MKPDPVPLPAGGYLRALSSSTTWKRRVIRCALGLVDTGLAALLALSPAGLCFAATNAPRAVAVMSVDTGRSAGLADQLTVKLSTDGSLRMLEREALGQIAREQALSGLSQTARDRVKLGHLTGADALVLVGRDQFMSEPGVRILVCDTATGTRIGQVRATGQAVTPDVLAEQLRSVLARFPQGVESAVAVPDLLSRDLRLEYEGLQTGLADLLREALAAQQGLAVVELEDARAIGEEKALTGGEVRRLTPLFIEGEYRTEALAAGGPTISLKFTLRLAGREAVNVESGAIPLADASRFVLGVIKPKALELLSNPGRAELDVGQQFAQLIERANRLAQLGDFDRAAALREAALLLRPNANDERIQLVRDYIRANHSPVEVWPKGAKPSSDDPFWSQVVVHSRELWRRSLFHVEYLIQNRCVDMGVGTGLFGGTLNSLMSIRRHAASTLKQEEALKKELLRKLGPVLFQLAPSQTTPAAQLEQRGAVAACLVNQTISRIDGNFIREEDLTLLGDLLCELIPEDVPAVLELLYHLRSGTRIYMYPQLNVTPEVWSRFAERLVASPRPLVHAYGRYARLCHQRYGLKESTEELLAQAKSLAADLGRPPLARLDSHKDFSRRAADEVVWADLALHPEKRTALRRPLLDTPVKRRPVEQPDGTLLCERVRLKPLTITLPAAKGQPAQLEERTWRCQGGFDRWRGLVPAWDDIDVIHAPGVVLFVGPDHAAREVLTGTNLHIGSVVFDGKYLWLGAGYSHGVYALDGAGNMVAHVSVSEGLPEAHYDMPLLALGPGRILAAGILSQGSRAWLATVELQENQPRVNVFHEALKVRDARTSSFSTTLDPALRFCPEWIRPNRDETGKRWAFIGPRDLPLMVDLDALTVSVYPARSVSEPEYFALDRPYICRGGITYLVWADHSLKPFRLNPQTHRFQKLADWQGQSLVDGPGEAERVVEYDGALYCINDRAWLRFRLDKPQSELLVTSSRSLPDATAGGEWVLAASKTAGLVAWHERKLYQVTVEP